MFLNIFVKGMNRPVFSPALDTYKDMTRKAEALERQAVSAASRQKAT